ncbi:MAG TPA: hypothetical protein VH352_18125 [Pseudonocardiaceae bacterium]|nr:hypothetical protein [Pseudonocardiaceae bacterium]
MPLASPSTTHHAAESPSNRTGLAVAALVFGVLAAGIALTVAFLGVFLPYAWYVVVVLAVLTLVCGLLSVGHKHHRSSTGGAIAWIGTVGGVVALVLGIWGVTDVVRGMHHTSALAGSPVRVLNPAPDKTAAPPAAPTTTPLGGPVIAIGTTYQLDNVTVRITGPDRFTPSQLAASSDGMTVQRAVQFTATVTNNTNAPLNANGVDIEGIVAGQTVGHVYDQDIRGVTQDIQPGQTITFPVAFNVPTATVPLLIEVNPQSMTSTDKVYYQGTV